MNSLRLKAIASFVDVSDKVVDVGCDHAYLAIYLKKNKLCQKVIASDINENALNSAKKNIVKANLTKEIPTILSDGLENINQNEIDTIVISGMGTATILHILEELDRDKIKKVIIQSNNDLYKLRKSINKFSFYLNDEKVIYEKGHYYVIGIYLPFKKTLTKRELHFGIYKKENKKYYQDLNVELLRINKKINYKHLKEKICILKKIILLKKYL